MIETLLYLTTDATSYLTLDIKLKVPLKITTYPMEISHRQNPDLFFILENIVCTALCHV